jgi:cytochrome-b5 reductase
MDHQATVLHTGFVTHDVTSIILDKPEGFTFTPGQSVDLALDRPDWRDQVRPFTMTSLPEDHILEFIVKDYPERHGVTTRMQRLRPGDRVLLSGATGRLVYQGPGVFIGGGTGITPLLSILRNLARRDELDGQQLILSNRTPRDIICERELQHYLPGRCLLTCTRESGPCYLDRRVDQDLLAEVIDGFDQHFYVCGPPAFTKDVRRALLALGAAADRILI